MINCLGKMPSIADTAKMPNTKRHSYNKTFKPLRKVGHLNIDGVCKDEVQYWTKKIEINKL